MSATSASRSDKPGPLVSGEFQYTQSDFEVIASTLYRETGIHLPPTKSTLVYSRIAKRLRALGLQSFRDYCALVGDEAGSEELAAMVSALTTNVTRFFREAHHFTHLKQKLFTPLIQKLCQGGRLRIWSAGCSSGQEPYSIALTLLSMLPDARSFDARILATDLNPHVIETGRQAIYPEEELEDVPAEMRRMWMEKLDDGSGRYQLDDAVRRLVTFRPLNLMGSWPMRGPFDIIFCRNVVIYFDEKTQEKIWNRFLSVLEPGGHLFIGHSERVVGPALAQLSLEATTTYRKRKDAKP